MSVYCTASNPNGLKNKANAKNHWDKLSKNIFLQVFTFCIVHRVGFKIYGFATILFDYKYIYSSKILNNENYQVNRTRNKRCHQN